MNYQRERINQWTVTGNDLTQGELLDRIAKCLGNLRNDLKTEMNEGFVRVNNRITDLQANEKTIEANIE